MTSLVNLISCYVLGVISTVVAVIACLWLSDFDTFSLLRCLVTNCGCDRTVKN